MYQNEIYRPGPELKGFEYLPSRIITDVIQNPDIQRSKDRKVRYLSDPKNMKKYGSLLALTDLDESDPHVLLPQSSGMNRGVILDIADIHDEPFFDEYNMAFSLAMAKGTFVTSLDATAYTRHGDPLGFFGLKDGYKELYGSNYHAAEGGRAGRVLGLLVLNPNELREHSFKRSKRVRDAIDKSLTIIERNGDKPCILLRLGGSERMQEFEEAWSDQGASRKFTIFDASDFFSPQRMLQRAASVILAEEERKGLGVFNEEYNTDLNQRDLIDLEKLKHSLTFTLGSHIITQRLQKAFKIHNRRINRIVSDKYFNRELSYPGARKHNYDLTGYIYDFEEAMDTDTLSLVLPNVQDL